MVSCIKRQFPHLHRTVIRLQENHGSELQKTGSHVLNDNFCTLLLTEQGFSSCETNSSFLQQAVTIALRGSPSLTPLDRTT